MTATGSTLATRFRWPKAWRGFAAFVRRPALPGSVTGVTWRAVRETLSLLALVLIACSTILLLFFAIEALGADLPENVLENETFTPQLIVLIALIAPVIEELIFRSWLTGRPAVAAFILFGIGGALLGAVAFGFGGPLAALAVTVVTLALIVWRSWRTRNRPTAPWYVRRFAYFYFGSAVAFAAVHLFNYGEGSSFIALLVLPQFVAGLVLGYARVTYGLWASIALHASFNSLLVSVVLLAEGLI